MRTQRKRLPANLFVSDEIAPEAVERLRAFLDRMSKGEWREVVILDATPEILVIDLTEEPHVGN